MVVEGTRFNDDDKLVLEKVKEAGLPVWLIVNKTDKVQDKSELMTHLQWLDTQFTFAHVIPVSAKNNKYIDELRAMVMAQLPVSEFYYPEEYITDRSSRFMAAEIIREKLMRYTGDELPYSVTVEIEQFKLTDTGVYRINGLILVERETQKRMVIGKQGTHLKKIGSDARRDLEALFEHKVFLELWVKVKSGWADDERALRSLGYND
jgi:GTP-binding protein Era